MEKGQRVSVTLEIKDKKDQVLSTITNRKGNIEGSANNENTAYFIRFNDRTSNEAISTKYITKIV
jgi:hypothetical protein